jgi:hypothetical protein
MGVPVNAYAATAVPATMDGGGVLIADKDPVPVAALIDRIVDDDVLRDRIIASQDAALDRLVSRDFGATLLRFIDDVRQSPRMPHPPVAPDFWEHVELAEKLAEVRRYRPAAFQALPKAGAAGATGAAGAPGAEGASGALGARGAVR